MGRRRSVGRNGIVGRAEVSMRMGNGDERIRARGMWAARAKRVSRRFVPDGHTAATAAVRLVAGLSVLSVETLLPTAVQSWAHLVGRILIIMSAWTLVGHVERTFTAHARMAGERVWAAITGRPVRPLAPAKPDEFA